MYMYMYSTCTMFSVQYMYNVHVLYNVLYCILFKHVQNVQLYNDIVHVHVCLFNNVLV